MKDFEDVLDIILPGLIISILLFPCEITAQNDIIAQRPSPESLKARHRIQVVAIAEHRGVDNAEQFAGKYSQYFDMRAYIIHKDGWYKVLIGDFFEKKQAKAALRKIKRIIKDAWLVTPDNNKIVSIWERGKKKTFREHPPTPTPTIPKPTATATPELSEKKATPIPEKQAPPTVTLDENSKQEVLPLPSIEITLTPE